MGEQRETYTLAGTAFDRDTAVTLTILQAKYIVTGNDRFTDEELSHLRFIRWMRENGKLS